MRAAAFLFLWALGVFPCYGQVVPSMVTSSMRVLPNGDIEIRATYKMKPGPIPAFLGDPFSLKRVFQKEQVLADGTKIRQQTPAVLNYQDSQGRVRAEYPFRRPANLPGGIVLPPQVEIIDSVAGYHYVLDTVHRIAHRGVIEVVARPPLPPESAHTEANPPRRVPRPAGGPNAVRSTEPLGQDTIEGVPFEGRRTVTTYPAGSRLGNDGPVSVTTEEWAAPGSSMPPFRKTSDPRSGDEVAASYDIDRGEPDPGLFLIPADYRIVDEAGPFAIIFVFPGK